MRPFLIATAANGAHDAVLRQRCAARAAVQHSAAAPGPGDAGFAAPPSVPGRKA